jgi:hypothetical protein
MPSGRPSTRLVEHQSSDLDNLPGAFSQGVNSVGRWLLERQILPSDQRFEAGWLLAIAICDRLSLGSEPDSGPTAYLWRLSVTRQLLTVRVPPPEGL